MADDRYPTYQMGGQTYYRVNPDVPEWQEKAMTWALDKTARMMAPIMKADPEPGLAAKAQMYERAVLNRDPSTITEKDMGSEVVQGAAQAAMRGMAAGRNTIRHEDYGYPNPARDAFGAAQLERPATGGVTIRDTFDFNNYELGRGNTVPFLFQRPFEAASWLGRRALPDGTGPQVSVNIPAAGMLQAKQELYGRRAPAMLGMPVNPQKLASPISSPMAQPSSLGLRTKK